MASGFCFPTHANCGFTLIEALVAALVLGIGILGLAGLQTVSLRSSLSAEQRLVAAELAYDLADRMRANNPNAGAGGSNASYLDDPPESEPDCSGGCDSANMAHYDLYQWNQSLRQELPDARSKVCLDSTPDDGTVAAPACSNSGSAYAIKIWWDEDRTGDTTKYTRFVTSIRP